MIRLFYYTDNFGDELSPYIVHKLSNDEVCYAIPYTSRTFFRNLLACIKHCFTWPFSLMEHNMSFSKQSVFFAIGSLIENSTDNCVIWGTGMAKENSKPQGGTFIMTRGPLSRKVVEANGYKVQKMEFGDPALLLPLVYTPKSNNKDKVGLVCHNSDFDQIKNLKLPKNIKLISLHGANVESVIDQIHECYLVYTTSLHGLIVSHAYGIKACWIERTPLPGGHFKFNDYLLSVGISPYIPIPIQEVIDKNFDESIVEKICVLPSMIKVRECQKGLLQNAPFKISNIENIWNQL